MAQGTRGRWIRAATTGFGVLICTGLVGCMNNDKPKDTKIAKQPGQGLPGTPMLNQNTGAANLKTGQPGAGQQFSGPGANLQQAGGFATSGGSGGRVGTTGLNPMTSAPTQQQYGNWPPGAPSTIGSPTTPGVSVQPGGPVGAAPIQNTGGATAFSSPPPPSLPLDPLPPPAPGRTEYASAPVLPPAPLSPVSPPAAPPGTAPSYPLKGTY